LTQNRYFLDIAYQGTNYHGWQNQANAHSIQAEIEAKLSMVLREKISIAASGRTDTGVHAEQQIIHLDTNQALQEHSHLLKFNAVLPKDITVKHIYPVVDTAHARFDAHRRTYQYRISPRKNPFLQNLCYVSTFRYDMDLMNEACKILAQYKNFESFSRVNTDVKHFICEIYQARWELNPELLTFTICANRFLRGMVRTIVGTMLDIGSEKLSLAEFENIILSKNRRKAGRAVPPEGLFLTKVAYPYLLGSSSVIN
jgi:tRNA pseudouridine38-40 synthase